MTIATVGFDLAKNVFQVHAVDSAGRVLARKALRRGQVLPFFAKLAPCLVGMEACGTSHYWGRQLSELGHDVRLMSPAYVKPYVKRGKTDAGDAEAICEAVTRPTMRFVPIKSPDQQAALALHRARDLLVRQRTQLVNMIRGLLGEFGITINRGLHHALELVTRIAGGATIEVPAIAARVVAGLGRAGHRATGSADRARTRASRLVPTERGGAPAGDNSRHRCRRGDRVRRHGDRPAAIPLR